MLIKHNYKMKNRSLYVTHISQETVPLIHFTLGVCIVSGPKEEQCRIWFHLDTRFV